MVSFGEYIPVFGPDHLIFIGGLAVMAVLLFLYVMIAHEARLRKGDKNTVFKWFLGYLVFVYFFNPLVDGNYFYLKHKPFLSDLSDVFYIPFVILLTYTLFSIGEALYMRVQASLTNEHEKISYSSDTAYGDKGR